MFGTINRLFRSEKLSLKDRRTILESVLGIDEVLPGSDEELEDNVDVDSVPEDAYKKLDAALDKIVEDPNYDDTEAEELADEDFDEDEIDDADLDAVINETCGAWLDA
ncbi:MAG: hypothetical protein NC489_08060 [Ruminococcus flavefaciens]|nr:hypothetical protein [Ruminococcus flavefaciens]